MKSDNSREAIVSSALQLFSARGYDAVSVNDIAEMAGITKPTLYYFFGNKEGLFRELLQKNYDSLHAILADACAYQPYAEGIFPVLLRIARAYFAYAVHHSDFYLMALALTFAPPTSNAAVIADEYHKKQYVLLEDIFVRMAEAHPNLRAKDRLCLWRFLAMVNAQIGFWYKGHGNLEDADAEAIVTLFMHGMFS